ARGLTKLKVENFQALVGAGLQGEIEGRRYFVGSPRLMDEMQVDYRPFAEIVLRHESMGETAVMLSNGDQALAVITMADSVKPSSKEAIMNLKALGIHVVMLTGDNMRTATKIGLEVGLTSDEIVAELKPE